MGCVKLPWLRGFLRLDYGVASPDTFERVFAPLDPETGSNRYFAPGSVLIPALARTR